MAPTLWIVAGPNGAGKTTCVQKQPIADLIGEVVFINPDDRTRSKLQNRGFLGFHDSPADLQLELFLQSAEEVHAELLSAVAAGKAVGVETVLSTDKYRELVEQVLAAQGRFFLIYVVLDSPELAKQRVANRVRLGGHGVPEDKIEQRWHRSLDNLPWFVKRATVAYVIDNSNSDIDTPPRLVACFSQGRTLFRQPTFPELVAALDRVHCT